LSLEKGKRVAAAGIFLFITPIPRTTQGRMRFPIKRLLLISIETIDHFTIEKPYLPTPAVTSFHPPLLGRGALIIPSAGGVPAGRGGFGITTFQSLSALALETARNPLPQIEQAERGKGVSEHIRNKALLG
jgi:hypothetical protein